MIEMGKKYTTRDGRAVRILATDMKHNYTVVGIVTPKDGHEFAEVWTSTGESLVHDMGIQNDLVPVPTKHEGWGVIYDNPKYGFPVFLTKEGAEKFYREDGGRENRIVHVTWEET